MTLDLLEFCSLIADSACGYLLCLSGPLCGLILDYLYIFWRLILYIRNIENKFLGKWGTSHSWGGPLPLCYGSTKTHYHMFGWLWPLCEPLSLECGRLTVLFLHFLSVRIIWMVFLWHKGFWSDLIRPACLPWMPSQLADMGRMESGIYGAMLQYNNNLFINLLAM